MLTAHRIRQRRGEKPWPQKSLSSHLSVSKPCPELRNQIWHYALPENIEATVYFNVANGPLCQFLTESHQDPEYDHENDRNNMRLEFRHNLMGDIQVHTPLVSVNHEARRIAVAWAHEQGY